MKQTQGYWEQNPTQHPSSFHPPAFGARTFSRLGCHIHRRNLEFNWKYYYCLFFFETKPAQLLHHLVRESKWRRDGSQWPFLPLLSRLYNRDHQLLPSQDCLISLLRRKKLWSFREACLKVVLFFSLFGSWRRQPERNGRKKVSCQLEHWGFAAERGDAKEFFTW